MPWLSGMRPRVCRRTSTAWPRTSSSLLAKPFHSWKGRQFKSEVWLSQSWLCGVLWSLTLEVTTFWRWYCKDQKNMTKSCKVTQMSLVYPPTCLGRQSICITFAVWTLPILTHTHIYICFVAELILQTLKATLSALQTDASRSISSKPTISPIFSIHLQIPQSL